VIVDDIQDDCDAARVTRIDQTLQRFRTAIRVLRGERLYALGIGPQA
jgi:hypothetical protein